MHDYVFIYILGCVATFTLLLFNTALMWFLRWITKANVVIKNIRKIEPPDETTFFQKVSTFILSNLFEILLSWISVLLQIWLTISTILTTLREVFTETPEDIKTLRYPLKNNPNMPPEIVWAHVNAIQLKATGKQLDVAELADSVNDLRYDYPSFNREYAVKHLKHLDVISADTLKSVLNTLDALDQEPSILS